MFERFTEKAHRAIFFARFEANRLGSQTMEPEHILLGLLREDKEIAQKYLRSPASVEALRNEIERLAIVPAQPSASMDIPLSQAAKRVLSYAENESRNLNHVFISSEYL